MVKSHRVYVVKALITLPTFGLIFIKSGMLQLFYNFLELINIKSSPNLIIIIIMNTCRPTS